MPGRRAPETRGIQSLRDKLKSPDLSDEQKALLESKLAELMDKRRQGIQERAAQRVAARSSQEVVAMDEMDLSASAEPEMTTPNKKPEMKLSASVEPEMTAPEEPEMKLSVSVEPAAPKGPWEMKPSSLPIDQWARRMGVPSVYVQELIDMHAKEPTSTETEEPAAPAPRGPEGPWELKCSYPEYRVDMDAINAAKDQAFKAALRQIEESRAAGTW